MSDNVKGWTMTEMVGMGMPNPKSVVKLPIPPELAAKWEAEAKARGMTLDDYLDELFAEAEDDRDQ